MSEEKFSAESVAKSEKVVGQLYEVIVNQKGVVLDGNHRLKGNPKWRTKVKETKNRAEEILVRLHAHHRRRVSKEETRSLLLELARELEEEGVPKEQVTRKLVEVTPYSESYVCELMPTEFKRASKVEAGRASAPLTEHKPEHLRHLLTCAVCDVASSDVQPWNDHEINLCPTHMAKARLDPARYLGQYGRKEIPEARGIQSHPPISVKDKWEYRAARMSPQHSKMEEQVLLKLQESNVRPISTNHPFCLLSTKPDLYFPSKNLAVYLDQEDVHRNRQTRDEELRSMLERRKGVRVLSVPYRKPTAGQVEQACKVIREAFNAS